MEARRFLDQPDTHSFNSLLSTTTPKMAKGRGSKSTKLAAAREQPSSTAESVAKSVDKGKAKQISEELRQAVKDLGGDDEDLDLIAGIDDSEDEQESKPNVKGKKAAESSVDAVRASISVTGSVSLLTWLVGTQEGSGGVHERPRLQFCRARPPT